MNDEIKMIPLDQIRILNYRHRDMKRFAMIVQSIKNQGLKKPIQVSEREANEGEGPTYDLVCGQGRIEALTRLHAASAFFRSVVSNLEMVLAKSSLPIAARYAELVADQDMARTVFGRIEAEWRASREAVLAITGQTALLENNPRLAQSIRLRLPYIDPLNVLQVELLRRHRAGEDDDDVRRGIHMSINGVSAGLRNSG